MEYYDTAKATRVWQRVQSAQQNLPDTQSLSALIAEELEDAATYAQLAKRISGKEAQTFVQYRDIESLESNNERIRRQKTFLLAFANTVLAKTKEDLTTPVKLFQQISDEVVTSLSVSDISYLASKAVNCEISMDNLTVIQGEVELNGKYAAFYPDETALYELILDTYYYKK